LPHPVHKHITQAPYIAYNSIVQICLVDRTSYGIGSTLGQRQMGHGLPNSHIPRTPDYHFGFFVTQQALLTKCSTVDFVDDWTSFTLFDHRSKGVSVSV